MTCPFQQIIWNYSKNNNLYSAIKQGGIHNTKYWDKKMKNFSIIYISGNLWW